MPSWLKKQLLTSPYQKGVGSYPELAKHTHTHTHTSSPPEVALKSTELLLSSPPSSFHPHIKWNCASCWHDFGLNPRNTLQIQIRKVHSIGQSHLFKGKSNVGLFRWNVSLFLVAPKFHRHVEFDGGCGITNLNIALSADIAPSGRATMNHYIDRHHLLQQAHVTGNFRHPSRKPKSWFQDKSKNEIYMLNYAIIKWDILPNQG